MSPLSTTVSAYQYPPDPHDHRDAPDAPDAHDLPHNTHGIGISYLLKHASTTHVPMCAIYTYT